MPQAEAHERTRGRLVWWLVLSVPALVLLAYVLAISFAVGDHFEPGLKVENRTADQIEVYEVFENENIDDVEVVLQAEVPPHESVFTTVECGNNPLIAKVKGSIVARRGPFPGCNMEDWVIINSD